jgi:iron complex outermembrane recepter protein
MPSSIPCSCPTQFADASAALRSRCLPVPLQAFDRSSSRAADDTTAHGRLHGTACRRVDLLEAIPPREGAVAALATTAQIAHTDHALLQAFRGTSGRDAATAQRHGLRNRPMNDRYPRWCAALAAAIAGWGAIVAPASAQNARQSTDDAFGFRAGIEQFGLYSESQARGFDLTRSNAYRIDDAYFVRTAALSDTIIENVAVRLGVGAARSATPSPTGVVGYRLKSSEVTRRRLAFGYRNFASPFLEADVRGQALAGTLGFAGGVVLLPDTTYPDGVKGRSADIGGIARAQLGDRLGLTGFASTSDVAFDGNYAFVPRGAGLPPVLDNQKNLGAPFAGFAATMSNAGVLADISASDATRMHVSALHSKRAQDEADFTLLAIGDSLDDGAQATLFRTPSTSNVSNAFEARADHLRHAGTTTHIFNVAARMRRSDSRNVGGTPFFLGHVSLHEPAYGPEPEFIAPVARIADSTDQDTVAAGYRAQVGDRLEIRAGSAFTRQQRSVRPIEGTLSHEDGTFVLPHASVVWVHSPTLSLFGSYVEGLEDSGVAPPSAANRNEILAPVLATQTELGFTRRWGETAVFTAALFDIAKPSPGIDAENVYRFLGNVRHRGAELTVAAGVGAATRVLAGITAFDARHDSGSRPAGISDRVGFVRLEHRLPTGSTLNALFNHRSGQIVGGRPDLRTSDISTLDVGVRHAFTLAGRNTMLSATAANILDEREWTATAGGVLARNGPRTFRVSLAMDF